MIHQVHGRALSPIENRSLISTIRQFGELCRSTIHAPIDEHTFIEIIVICV
ncbi:hypothetical protein PHLH6_20080 [Pseudomonas sp. Seg1]|nr:hypothetical protein PHLH6_20080 [Pseudomonas sp. Seg1]